jgi:hypothetical protein
MLKEQFDLSQANSQFKRQSVIQLIRDSASPSPSVLVDINGLATGGFYGRTAIPRRLAFHR